MYAVCRHLFTSGRRCTQPAVGRTLYCRHHQVVKRTVAKSVLPVEHYGLHRPLPFAYPEDRASIQANCFLVLRALDDRRINTQTSNAMNRLLRTCELNLKRGPLHEPEREEKSELRPARRNPNEKWLVDDEEESQSRTDHESIVRNVILTPEGDEIAEPREIWEDSEEESHGETCPCQKCAEQYRGAAPEPHHTQCQCERCGPANTEDVPSLMPAPAAAKDCRTDLTADSEEERLNKLAAEAHAIFKELGFPEPSTSSDAEQEPAVVFPRTILQKQNQEESHGFAQELLCNTASPAPPCPSSSSPSLPTTP